MEEKLTSLRDQRAQVKRELTLVSNKLSTAINRKESISTLQPLVNKADELFNNFSAIHLEYVDIIDDNESVDERHKKVGGVSLSDYFDKVQSSHDTIYSSFCSYTKSVFVEQIGVIEPQICDSLDELAFLNDKIESLSRDHSILDVAAQVYFDEANQCIITLDKILAELKETGDKIGHDYSALYKQARDRMVTIKRTIVTAKAGMTSSPLSLAQTQSRSHVQYNNDSTPQTHSQPLTSSINHSATLSVSEPDTRKSPDNPLRTPSQNENSSDHLSSVSAQPVTHSDHQVGNHDGTPGSLKEGQTDRHSVVSKSSVTHAYMNTERNQGHTHTVMQPPATTQPTRHTGNDHSGEAHFRKAPLPTFNGDRTEWAEFRTVWKLYGARTYSNQEDKAWALKQCLKGEALAHVKAIFCNQPDAYERIWDRLDHIYSDLSMSVQQAYNDMNKIGIVNDDDSKSLISFINSVENCYSQLGEVKQLTSITMSHIDDLCDKLPLSIRKDWMRLYRSLDGIDKIHPFTKFMQFLETERDVAIRLSERRGKLPDKPKPPKSGEDKPQAKKGKSFTTNAKGEQGKSGPPNGKCLIHTYPKVSHSTEECRLFLGKTAHERKSLLQSKNACYRCLKIHKRDECQAANTQCGTCRQAHHELLCFQKHATDNQSSGQSAQSSQSAATHHGHAPSVIPSGSLFAIQSVIIASLNTYFSRFIFFLKSKFLSEKALNKSSYLLLQQF